MLIHGCVDLRLSVICGEFKLINDDLDETRCMWLSGSERLPVEEMEDLAEGAADPGCTSVSEYCSESPFIEHSERECASIEVRCWAKLLTQTRQRQA